MMRMIVATDGSPHAKSAAKLAARLAGALREAEVVLVNVGHIPATAIGGPGVDYVGDYGILVAGFEKAGQTILGQTEEEFHGIDVPVKKQYRRGEPSHEILAAATEMKADLIVMGSHGLGQIGGLILGQRERTCVAWGAHPRVDRPVGDGGETDETRVGDGAEGHKGKGSRAIAAVAGAILRRAGVERP